MNWNPFKRIADLERRVEKMHRDMLIMAAEYSMRMNTLEIVKPVAKPMTLEEAQALADKRVRQNAYARKYYAKRKAQKAGQA